jgi:hypothetical protein
VLVVPEMDPNIEFLFVLFDLIDALGALDVFGRE